MRRVQQFGQKLETRLAEGRLPVDNTEIRIGAAVCHRNSDPYETSDISDV